MRHFKAVLPLLLSAALGPVWLNPANAQETRPSTNIASMSLEALVAETLERNPELKFYDAEIVAAKAGRRSAGLLANPELSVEVGQKDVRSAGFSDEGVAWSASIMQPLEWPGRIGLRKAIANRDIELAELGRERFKLALAARVRALGFAVFAAQERAAASGEVAERFRALREVLVQRDPAGLTPLLETRVIEATEVNARRRATAADLAVRSALLELNHLRGAPIGSQLAIERTRLKFQPVPKLEALVASALANSFELRLRAAELAQQGFQVELARNERYPSIAVGPAVSEERVGDERERIIGLSVSLPLPLWNRNASGIRSAEARQLQAETSYYVTQREVEQLAREAVLTYEAKLQDMAHWRPDAIQHFKDAAELADRHYRLGAVPVATFVELQKQYLEAVESLLETKQEALAAAGQLELLTGRTEPLVLITHSKEEK